MEGCRRKLGFILGGLELVGLIVLFFNVLLFERYPALPFWGYTSWAASLWMVLAALGIMAAICLLYGIHYNQADYLIAWFVMHLAYVAIAVIDALLWFIGAEFWWAFVFLLQVLFSCVVSLVIMYFMYLLYLDIRNTDEEEY